MRIAIIIVATYDYPDWCVISEVYYFRHHRTPGTPLFRESRPVATVVADVDLFHRIHSDSDSASRALHLPSPVMQPTASSRAELAVGGRNNCFRGFRDLPHWGRPWHDQRRRRRADDDDDDGEGYHFMKFMVRVFIYGI